MSEYVPHVPVSAYVPTTDEVETAFHEFASDLETRSPGEYAEAPEFTDWREAMQGFRRWKAALIREAKAEAWVAHTKPSIVGAILRDMIGALESVRAERDAALARIAEAAKLHRPVPTGREMYVTGNAGEIYGVEPTYICPSGCNNSVSFFKGDECESWKTLGLNEGDER